MTEATYPTYATVADVQASDRARVIGSGNNPGETDVQGYLEMAAAKIDSILVNKGYELPIPADAAAARQLLRSLNIKGAVVQMEKASPTHPDLAETQKAYDAELQELIDADTIMDVPKDVQRAEPRGPGVTHPPPSIDPDHTGPFFTRDMRF